MYVSKPAPNFLFPAYLFQESRVVIEENCADLLVLNSNYEEEEEEVVEDENQENESKAEETDEKNNKASFENV